MKQWSGRRQQTWQLCLNKHKQRDLPRAIERFSGHAASIQGITRRRANQFFQVKQLPHRQNNNNKKTKKNLSIKHSVIPISNQMRH
jgi:hypothetical protein